MIYPSSSEAALSLRLQKQPHRQRPKQQLQPPTAAHSPPPPITCRVAANAQTGRVLVSQAGRHVCSMRIIAARMLRAIASTPRPPNTRLKTSSSNASAPLRPAATPAPSLSANSLTGAPPPMRCRTNSSPKHNSDGSWNEVVTLNRRRLRGTEKWRAMATAQQASVDMSRASKAG